MKTYPIMLDIRGKTCVVIGAGEVGLRKVRSLLAAGARVRLVDERPVAAAGLEGVEIIQAPYTEEQLAGALLVFACTGDRAVNARVAEDARSTGAMVNAADQPEDCDFFAPAVIAEGDVVIAIGTGGSAPGLAAFLRRQLAPAVPPRVGEFAAELAKLRDQLQNSCPDSDTRIAIMRQLSGEEGYNAFKERGLDGLQELLHDLLRRKH